MRQKSSKNTPKKHNENTTTHFQPKGRQKVTKKRPTREGKGGIQDGILLEKKRILQKPDLLRGKGACWKGKPQTLRSSTRPCGGPHTARGRISVACGNSSAPGPREDNLHAKNLQEIWCQGQCRCIFLQNTALKDEFRPKRAKTKPRGCKITKIWPYMAPKGTQFEPKGHQNDPKGCQRGAKSEPEINKNTTITRSGEPHMCIIFFWIVFAFESSLLEMPPRQLCKF